MDVVWHDGPSHQSIADAIEVKQSILDDLGDDWIPEPTGAVACVEESVTLGIGNWLMGATSAQRRNHGSAPRSYEASKEDCATGVARSYELAPRGGSRGAVSRNCSGAGPARGLRAMLARRPFGLEQGPHRLERNHGHIAADIGLLEDQ